MQGYTGSRDQGTRCHAEMCVVICRDPIDTSSCICVPIKHTVGECQKGAGYCQGGLPGRHATLQQEDAVNCKRYVGTQTKERYQTFISAAYAWDLIDEQAYGGRQTCRNAAANNQCVGSCKSEAERTDQKNY